MKNNIQYIKLTKEEYNNLPKTTKQRNDLKFCVITEDKLFYDTLEYKQNVIVFFSEGAYKNYVKIN
jgi:hypothetical protein